LKFRLLAVVLVLIAVSIAYGLLRRRIEQAPNKTVRVISVPGTITQTAHYSIRSTATPQQTALVGEAVEYLYDAYSEFFAGSIPPAGASAKLQLTLYRDQREFKRHNRSSPWAEAYYQAPTCYAYYAAGEKNPYHWMLHEATHQMNNEVAHFARQKWIDEGLASYFGASEIRDHRLIPGSIDVNAYPIWWLPSLSLSGNLQQDIESRKIIPLRALISGAGGPDISQNVNAYYIGYWSLTHFLFHFDHARYADRYRKVIAEGGTLTMFEKNIGPVDQVQAEWYGYLRQKADAVGNP
jgi:hypothetical protein